MKYCFRSWIPDEGFATLDWQLPEPISSFAFTPINNTHAVAAGGSIEEAIAYLIDLRDGNFVNLPKYADPRSLAFAGKLYIKICKPFLYLRWILLLKYLTCVK